MQHISERFKWIRDKHLGFTQTKMAAALDVGETTIKNYESKNGTMPGSAELIKLYELDKNINVCWLLTGEGKRLLSDNSCGEFNRHHIDQLLNEGCKKDETIKELLKQNSMLQKIIDNLLNPQIDVKKKEAGSQ